ncbi:unnamed protein product [Prorocentrum cordatum]|uniref:Uncharacterized protein n=1 Tax=Prorocentrum cordatum TaxID=2364126 RepID=A0ABN9SPH6_9DINO|nr:unnamed protein product [Polarella glacialis]
MRADEVLEIRRLVHVASECFGPCARVQVLRSSDVPGARTVFTTSSTAVLQIWPVASDHHILRLILDTTSGHLQRHGDGGWLFVNFCLRVVLSLLGGRLRLLLRVDGLARPAALHGLALASAWLREALASTENPCRQAMSWSDLQSVLSLLRSSLCKPVAFTSARDASHLGVIVLEAFLEALPRGDMESFDPEANIHAGPAACWFCGPAVLWSSAVEGLVLDTPAAIVSSSERYGENSMLALFDVSLESWLPSAPVGQTGAPPLGLEALAVETPCDGAPADVGMLRQWELSQFERLARALLEAGVHVLACQKLVDPWLEDFLRCRGVSVLSRLSLRHVGHLRRLSGAVPVTSLAALPQRWEQVVGVIGPIESRTICERTYTIISPPASNRPGQCGRPPSEPARVMTLLVGAPDEHALAELKRCVPQAVRSLHESALRGTVLLGAGLTEVHLADALERRARRPLPEEQAGAGPARRAVLAVAECLRDVAQCLQPGGGLMAARGAFLDGAREALQQAAGGWPAGAPAEAEEAKRAALLGALDLAGVLLRLGGTLDFARQPLA